MKDFVSTDNGVVTSGVLDIDDTIKHHATGDEDGDGTDKSDDKLPPHTAGSSRSAKGDKRHVLRVRAQIHVRRQTTVNEVFSKT